MKIEKRTRPEKVLEPCAVVIDVLRAFTTAAFAFSRGCQKIIPVDTVEKAFTLQAQFPDALLMGEVEGKPIKGFHFGNSPTEIQKQNLQGKTLIQRTSAGTQGIHRSLQSKKILIASFPVAEATFKRIIQFNPHKVTFVITGEDEDVALADYLESKFSSPQTHPASYLERVFHSPQGIFMTQTNDPALPLTDLHAAAFLDAFPFAMELFLENSLPHIYPVDEHGRKIEL